MKCIPSGAIVARFAISVWLAPATGFACACGCNVFDVGTGSMLPTDSGGTAFVEYDFMDQNQNRSGGSAAPGDANADKEIRTNFYTAGVQYFPSRKWGVMLEAPVWNRRFRTETTAGSGVDTFTHTAIGDVRLTGVFTGLSQDLSTGLILGVKLPTGDWKYAGFDRDTEIGTGSTDILVGGYHRGALTKDNHWSYVVQALGELPVAGQAGYRPGDEVDAAAGVYYNGLRLGSGRLKVSPVLQVFAAVRAKDSGPAAHPGDTGYERVMISPGVEVSSGAWRLYGDVELPVQERFNGHQLAAPFLVKVVVSHGF
jgi:hypothetical protein